MSYRTRTFESDGLRPADSGYGCPQPRQMAGGRGKRMKKALRKFHNVRASRAKSRRGLGTRSYR